MDSLIRDLFDLSYTVAAPLLKSKVYPWEALPPLADFIRTLGRSLPADLFMQVGEDIFIDKSAQIDKSAHIEGPAIIGEAAQIRHGAFIRGSAIIGRSAVVGNSSEVKNAILFDGVQIPHYNYVGDSILGYMAHMGAGAIASNIRSDKKPVSVRVQDSVFKTDMRKIGAFVGDYAEIGCNTVLFPGAIVGRHSIVYPLTRVRGFVAAHSICKSEGVVVARWED